MPQTLQFLLRGVPPKVPWQHGIGLRALVLAWFQAIDPEISAALHARPKPYAVTPVDATGRPEAPLAFAVSVGPDWLAEVLLAGARGSSPLLELGSSRFELVDIVPGPAATWPELCAQPAPPPWNLEFLSPTAHRLQDRERGSAGARGPRRLLPRVVIPSPAGMAWAVVQDRAKGPRGRNVGEAP